MAYEPDFPVAANNGPGGLDINALIAAQLAPLQSVLNRPAPNIPTGTSIVPEEALRASIERALSPTPPPLRDDQRYSVLGRIGAALMQPRQQGQSVAGNIGAAVNQGTTQADLLRKENQATAERQAQLGSNMATADVNRRTAEANLQVLAAKFPVEYAELQQRLRNATLQGKTAEVEAIRAVLMQQDGAKRIVESMNTAQQKATADARKVEADTRHADADTERLQQAARVLIPAQAQHLYDLTRPDSVTVVDKEAGTVLIRRADGSVDYVTIKPPLDAKTAQSQAEKELKEEMKEAHKAKGGFGWFSPNPTQAQIRERAAKLMRGEMTTVGTLPSTGKKPATPTGAQPTGTRTEPVPAKAAPVSRENFPVETPEARRAAAQKQIDAFELELADPNIPEEQKASIRAELEKAKLVATAENPHVTDKARKPGSVYKPAAGTSVGPRKVVLGPDGKPTFATEEPAGSQIVTSGGSAVPGREAATTVAQGKQQSAVDKVLALGETYEKQYPKLKAFRTLMMSKNPTIAAHGYQQYYAMLESLVGKIDL